MTRRYDLLVIDLDGTLLGSDGRVSAADRNAIHDARGAGLEVLIATGRSLKESREALAAIGHDGLVIAAGGSMLCDSVTGCTLERRAMPLDVVTAVTEAVVSGGHKALILKDAHAAGYDYAVVGSGPLDPASEWWFEQLDVDVRFLERLDDDAHPRDTVRAGAVACATRLEPLVNGLRSRLGDRCCLQHWSAVTATASVGASTHLMEAFTPNVNKWTMVQAYCERRRLSADRVAAIGDGLNDVELVQRAGLGIAMANAGPHVLAVADRVTRHHDEGGVSHAVSHILRGAW